MTRHRTSLSLSAQVLDQMAAGESKDDSGQSGGPPSGNRTRRSSDCPRFAPAERRFAEAEAPGKAPTVMRLGAQCCDLMLSPVGPRSPHCDSTPRRVQRTPFQQAFWLVFGRLPGGLETFHRCQRMKSCFWRPQSCGCGAETAVIRRRMPDGRHLG